jgi:hypothetical protein
MKQSHSVALAIGLAMLCLCAFVVTFLAFDNWRRSQPSWRLSAEAREGDSVVTVTTTASDEPTYTVVIKGWKIGQPFQKLLRTETASIGAIKTVSFDDTIPPGAWSVKIGDVKMNVMPARLVVNDAEEFDPGEKIVIDGKSGKCTRESGVR